MRWARALIRTVVWTVTALAVLAVGAVWVLTSTRPGVEYALGRGLELLEGRIDGSVEVAGIESGNLLDGALLRGVRIADPSGVELLRADTLRVRYSPLTLLGGDVIVDEVELRGFDLLLERMPGEKATNVERIFAPAGDTTSAERADGERRRVLLRDVRLARGAARIRLPVDDPDALPEGAFTEPAPGGGLLRRYTFDDVDARLHRVSLSEPGREGQRLQLAALSTVAGIQREPVAVKRLTGDVTLVGSSLVLGRGRLELAESRARADVRLDWSGEGVVADAELGLQPLALSELAWLLPELPDARARGELGVRVSPDSTVWRVDRVEVVEGDSRLRVQGGFRTDPGLAARDAYVELDPLSLPRLERVLERPLPLAGSVRGNLNLDGTPRSLAVGGRLTLAEEGYAPVTARISGGLELGERRGVQGLEVFLEEVDYALLRELRRDLAVTGTGSVRLEADGWLDRGMRVALDLRHRDRGVSASRIFAGGRVRLVGDEVHLDLAGDLAPLDLRALRAFAPDRELEGTVRGPVRLGGRIGDLRVETDLETGRGRVAGSARFDARDPAAGYELEGEVDDLLVSGLVPGLPDPTRISASVTARGRGFDRDVLAGRGRVRLRGLRVGRFTADTATVEATVERGVLRIDTLDARTNVARLTGSGTLGIASAAPEGELRIGFANDSLATIRPFLLGDSVIARDTLTALEREVVAADGIDPDTLPTREEVALEGRLEGEVTVRGTAEAFSAEGGFAVREVIYGASALGGADVQFTASALPGLDGAIRAVVDADSIRWGERSYSAAHLEVDYARPAGDALIELERDSTESYRARAAFEGDRQRGVVHLDELLLRFEPVRWNLGGPATFEWDEEGIRIRDFRLIRPGVDGMRIAADGILPYRGDADFDLDVRNLPLEQLADLAQWEEGTLGGRTDLRVRLTGTSSDPSVSGSASVDSLRVRDVRLSRVEAEVDYGSRRLGGRVHAWHDGLLAARVEGSVPVDFALGEVEDRIPAGDVDLRAVVDSFPVAVLASTLEDVEQVEGTVTGDLRFDGTPDDLRPSGGLRLRGGAFTLPALGIRPVDVAGSFDLSGRHVATVDLEARSRGGIGISGTVDLASTTNPGFDLAIRARGFQAVNRRDLQGRIGGEVSLTGSYERPVIGGSVRVEEGSLRIEELERSAEVVDLSDPRFFDVVDTTLVAAERPLREGENPFLDNLRMDVDLQVQRTWLRSREMNVEIGGELVMDWNRNAGDMVLSGQLNAIRGNYSQFGRQFQVREGTVEFVATPGLNPNLSIEAVTRLRTVQGEPLTITATLSGTLQEPRVRLTSDAQPPIAESDLVSYLIFGRPSYALGSGESALLQGANQLLGGAASMMASTAANQLGTVAREVGVDYLAVSQAPGTLGGVEGGNRAAETQVEAGWYFRENVFVSVLFRPLAGMGPTTQDRFSGVRAEWQLGDVWTVQGFVEDRFSRQQVAGFGDLGYRLSEIFGFFVYRDWGY